MLWLIGVTLRVFRISFDPQPLTQLPPPNSPPRIKPPECKYAERPSLQAAIYRHFGILFNTHILVMVISNRNS